ncbi:MAG: hypothetical protein HQK72_15745 [Desulfamplus sp.]|nr:hypothetical protein [Desulfamplus sp.]
MAIQGFDTNYFIDALFAYAKEEYSEWATGKTTDDLKELLGNFYPDAEDVDAAAEQFYTEYGAAWGLAPNAYFNAAEYRLAYAEKQVAENKAFTVDAALKAYDAELADEEGEYHGDAYAHYLAVGAAMGVNPSNAFDESDYLQSIIDGTDSEMTVDELRQAAIDAGLTPVDFYVDYPEYQTEYPAIPVTGDELVNVTPVMTSFTLTNGSDTATANIFNAPQVYTPGGDDRINSLQDEDRLTGTGTNPTLTADLGNANDNGARVITPELNNIETLNVAFTGSDAAFAVTTLDLQDETGLNALNVTRISQAVNGAEVANIMTALTDISIANTNANQTGVAEVSFTAGVLAGDNSANLTISNVNVNNLNIGMNTSGVGAVVAGAWVPAFGVGTQGYENLTIKSSGAANTIGALNVPMDTDTDNVLKITGDKDLTLAQTINVVSPTGVIESQNHTGGVQMANGRLAAIDASEFTGNLTLNIANGNLTTNKAGTSGVVQNVSITGGTGNDTFYLADVIQAGDSITGGDGTDTMVIVNGGSVGTTSSVVGSVETLKIELNATNGLAVGTAAANQTATVDFDKLASVTSISLRNVSNSNVAFPGPAAPFAGAIDTYTLNNLTAAQAAAISIMHSDSLNNNILNNIINANLKTATGTSDTVAVTISEGVNNDPRFNFILNAASVENITLVDADSESNTVALGNFGNHTGTLTIGTTAGTGVAGSFLNLDTTATGTNGGVYQYSTTGLAVAGAADAAGFAAANGQIIDLSAVVNPNQVKIAAATINASAELGNVIVRVSSNAASAVGAQAITMGAGNDTVIFDNAADNRAGLTISDTVAGGAGTGDVLMIDGNLTVAGQIALGASEWTNVTGFETIRLVNPGPAGSSYALTLTDSLITNNNNNGSLAIVNDHDPINDTGRTVAAALAFNVAAVGAGTPVRNNAYNAAGQTEAPVTIDARSLSASAKFSYNGEEGSDIVNVATDTAGSSTIDRIIFSDVNINGNAVVDGGALDNITDNRGIGATTAGVFPGNATIANKGNADTIEVRNAAVVSQGDLANIKNIGTLSFTNDTAVTQVSTLQLNDTIVDAMVDSYQASASRAAAATASTPGANVEVLQINAVDNMNVAAATVGMTIEAASLTDKSDLDITLGRGANNVATGAGQDRVVLLGNYLAGTYAAVENGVNINTQSTTTAVARAVTDTINMGAGTDTLVTYGAINLAGATLTGIETIVANSALVLTAAQYRALTSLTFTGNTTHQLRIIGDAGAALDLSKISLGTVMGANGSLTISTLDANNVAMVNAPTGAIVDNSNTGDVVVGTVDTAPVNNSILTSATVALTAGGTFTGTSGVNDTFTGNTASLVGTTVTGTATDTESLTITDAAGAVPATITNIDIVNLFNGTNNLSFAGIINGATNVVTVNGGTGADTVTLGAVGLTAGLTGAASSVALGAGNDTLSLQGTRTGSLLGGDGTDTLTLTAASDLSGATLSSFETLTGNFTLSVTAAQYAGFTTMTDSAIITLTTAGSVTTQAGAPLLTLANGTNTVNASAAASYGLVGGTGADTFAFGATLTAGDTVTAGTGTDIITVTGAATGSNNITAVETIQVNYATAATFTTGAITPGVASTITAAGSTAAATIDARDYVVATSLGITDGAANDILYVPTTVAGRALTTVTLSGGGSDTVFLNDLVHLAASSTGATITNFTTGVVAGADVLDLNFDVTASTASYNGGYNVITAAAAAATVVNDTAVLTVFEVNQVAGATTSLTDVADGGAVEQALAAAFGTVTNAGSFEAAVILYGAGAAAGNAGIYSVTFTGAADAITGNMTVELIGVVNSVTADSFVSSNIA